MVQTAAEALETALEGMELSHDAAPVVASARKLARAIDDSLLPDDLNKLTRTLLLHMQEIRSYRVTPELEDPWDTLARKLAGAE